MFEAEVSSYMPRGTLVQPVAPPRLRGRLPAVGDRAGQGSVYVPASTSTPRTTDISPRSEPLVLSRRGAAGSGRCGTIWSRRSARSPAAAIAAGLTPLEVGSDLAGSLRLPAHYCGVYGMRTSYGIVPTRGHIPRPPDLLTPSDMLTIGPWPAPPRTSN